MKKSRTVHNDVIEAEINGKLHFFNGHKEFLDYLDKNRKPGDMVRWLG